MGNKFNLFNQDCLLALQSLPDNSIDSVVTDPPYGLSNHTTEDVIAALTAWISGQPYQHSKKGFMGHEWDSFPPGPEIWKEVFRVLKPGGHLLCFAGSRTMDLMSMAIRLSGFELRDNLGYANTGNAPLMAWCYSQGFPKSHNISIAIDKQLGAKREIIGTKHHPTLKDTTQLDRQKGSLPNFGDNETYKDQWDITAPATEESKQWQGWGTALKPAFEPIIMARKPIEKTVANNVLTYGTGGINIDACRVPVDTVVDSEQLRTINRNLRSEKDGWGLSTTKESVINVVNEEGRFPTNLLLEKSDSILSLFPNSLGQRGNLTSQEKQRVSKGIYGNMPPASDHIKRVEENKSAARYFNQFECDTEDFEVASKILFYTPKANTKDREEGLLKTNSKKSNIHPSVKPTELMRHLVKLVTPHNGICCDPFMGSGTTGKACALENVLFIGCELSTEYFTIAKQRIEYFYQQNAN